MSLEDLGVCKISGASSLAELELSAGNLLLRVTDISLTSNNITYAAFGKEMGYWGYFPAPKGWGRIPVWGFATVVRSEHRQIAVGERIYGFLPISNYVTMLAVDVHEMGFSDGALHRTSLPSVYNRYTRMAGNGATIAWGPEDMQLLWRPTFRTSFLLSDILSGNDYFDAETLIITSASSRTGIALAQILSWNPAKTYEILGLSSGGNLEFVDGLGCYDKVVAYEEIGSLPGNQRAALIDIAGNAEVRAELHHHFGDNMRYSCMVGATHLEKAKRSDPLPGAEPTLYFAPAHVQKRERELGEEGLQREISEAWLRFLERANSDYVEIKRTRGIETVPNAYLEVLRGHSRPDNGLVISL